MKYIITIAACLFATLSYAQTPEKECNFNDALLDNMTGHWTMAGDMGTQKVAYNFSAQWVLNHKFMEWDITDILKSPPSYTAKVYVGYDCKSNQYIVHWIDNMGGKFSETLGYGIKKGDAIEVKFKYPNAPSVNTISYDKAKGTWQFHLMWQDKNKKWSTWSKTMLVRKR
jgi:hypothetical protein